MAMNVGGGKGGPKAEINVTPLVDVVLVLLIIFMVVTPMMQNGVEVSLPKAANVAPEAKEDSPLVVTIDKDRNLYFENKPVLAADLEAKVKAARTEHPARKLLVKGDKSLSYGAVREALHLLRKTGLEGLSLAVEKAVGEAP